jgi:hypothetical protein
MAPKAGSKRTEKAPPPAADNPNVELGSNAGAMSDDDRQALFLKHKVQAEKDNEALEKALEIVRGVRKKRNNNRNLCRTDGFPLAYLDEILEEQGRTTAENEKDAEVRTLMRVASNLPVIGARQLDMFEHLKAAETPEGERDETYYRTQGYSAGFAGQPSAPQDLGVPPGEPTQWWQEGWGDGQTVRAQRLARAEELTGQA